ncbi:MAG: lamin tail domain-containing protein [Minisyncoccota bacterium]
MRITIFISSIFFALARIVSAQVFISEIMYDPKGADASAGGEWIEVQNESSLAVSLTEWLFFEGDTNHSITADGVAEIPSGGYAVISRDITAFKNYFPNFSGALFKASFSLNDGEKLAVKNSKDALVTAENSVIYASDQGAKNDGNSLQKINGLWSAAAPTPGVGSLSSSAISQESSQTSSSNESVSITAAVDAAHFPVEPQIFTKITAQTQTVSVGAAATFTGRVWGLKKEPIENARMIWALGDGARAEGASVLHTYYYPGEYTVILDAASGYYAASDRVRVVAVTPALTLATGGDEVRSFATLENHGNDELDLSEWQLVSQGKTFFIPKNTRVGAHTILTFASEVTGLVTPAGSNASLHFPNGSVVALQKKVRVAPADEKMVAGGEVTQGHALHAPVSEQTANVLTVLDGSSEPRAPASSESSPWVWYTGVALLSALALLGVRFARTTEIQDGVTANDFEIIDEDDDKKDDLF